MLAFRPDRGHAGVLSLIPAQVSIGGLDVPGKQLLSRFKLAFVWISEVKGYLERKKKWPIPEELATL
jgi:hypothetical protein